jgi:predicted nucleic acid-binding protein
VESGDVRVRIADTVVFETVFLLQKRHNVSKAQIRDSLLELIELPAVELPNKQRLRRVLDLYVEANMSFADAFHVALMEQLGIEEIVSFDRDFDRVPGITRVEPR